MKKEEYGIDLKGLGRLFLSGNIPDGLRLSLAIASLYMPLYAAGLVCHMGPVLYETARFCGLDTECLYFIIGWRGIAATVAGGLSIIGTALNYRYWEILSHKHGAGGAKKIG